MGERAIVVNCNDTGFRLSALGTAMYLQLKGLPFTCVPPRGTEVDADFSAFYVKDALFCPSRIERDDPCLVEVVRRLGPLADAGSTRLQILQGRTIKRDQNGKLWIELDV